MKVRIKNFNITPARVRKSGAAKVASFDAVVNDVGLYGCEIVRHADGTFTAVPPPGDSGREGIKAVWFADSALRDEFVRRALVAYRALADVEEDVASPAEPVDEPDDAGMRRFLRDEVIEMVG